MNHHGIIMIIIIIKIIIIIIIIDIICIALFLTKLQHALQTRDKHTVDDR